MTAIAVANPRNALALTVAATGYPAGATVRVGTPGGGGSFHHLEVVFLLQLADSLIHQCRDLSGHAGGEVDDDVLNALLEFLMRHAGQAVSKAAILDAVWAPDFDGASNIVEVYVGCLRRKTGHGTVQPTSTIRCAGAAGPATDHLVGRT